MLRFLAASALGLIVACGAPARAPRGAAPPARSEPEVTPIAPAEPRPPLPSTSAAAPPVGYATTWANAARSSRVGAASRAAAGLTRVAALGEAPLAVVVDDAGTHVGLDFGDHYELRDAAGTVRAKGSKAPGQPLVVWATGALAGGRELSFADDGSVTTPAFGIDYAASSDRDVTWAAQVGSLETRAIVEKKPEHFMHHAQHRGTVVEVDDVSPARMAILATSFPAGRHDEPGVRRSAELQGTGCGAIGGDGRIVVALADKRLVVYDGRAAGDGPLTPSITVTLDAVATDLSVVEGGVALLSGPPEARTLHLLTAAGREAWRVAAPFAVAAPPIDAGKGRVYLAGAGLAAAEDGKILWSTPAPRVFVTALADGRALAAVGAELRLVNRDGTIAGRLRAPGGDELVTPPAVAADGTAWVASAKSLFFAR
jgi:hypothetical protein